MMTNLTPLFLIILLSCSAGFASEQMAADDADVHTPGWVKRYLNEKPVGWTSWRNTLKPQGQAADPLQLAQAGETEYVIVHPVEPTIPERRAAQELAFWLGAITGAEFPVVTEADPRADGKRSLRVGRVHGSSYAGVEPVLGKENDGRYEISVRGETLSFEGPGLTGPLNAVYAFLEEDLGVRWLDGWRGIHPNDPQAPEGWSYSAYFGEMDEALLAEPVLDTASRLPQDPDLEIAVVPRAEAPAYSSRGFYLSRPWDIRNRLNLGPSAPFDQHYYAGGLFVHTYHKLVPPSKYFESNPEYFAYVDGEWRWERAQINLANPKVVEIAAQTAIDRLRNVRPGQRMVSVSPMDWAGFSEDPESVKKMKEMGDLTGLVLDFANRVTARIAEEIPDVKVTVLSYRHYNRAPAADLELHPNLYVRFCTDFGSSFDFPYHSYYDAKLELPIGDSDSQTYVAQRPNLRRWMELTDRFHLWLYPHQYRNGPTPMPNIRAVAENLRFFAEHGFSSAFVEQYPHLDSSSQAMRFWVWAKLMWNPKLDVDDLMLDFIWAYYGDAAPAVQAYHRLLWDHAAKYNDFERRRGWTYDVANEGMYGHGFVPQALEILDGTIAETEDPAIRERLEWLRFGVLYVDVVRWYEVLKNPEAPFDPSDFAAARERFHAAADALKVDRIGYYDGAKSIMERSEFNEALNLALNRRVGGDFLPLAQWEEWQWRPDPEDLGVKEGWNDLFVRIHNSAYDAGIHKPVLLEFY